MKSANIQFTKEASAIPLPYHSSTPHADQLGLWHHRRNLIGRLSRPSYRPRVGHLLRQTVTPDADCLTYFSPTTVLVTPALELSSLDLINYSPTMDARRPPEYTLEIAADRTNVKDVVKGSNNMSAR